MVGVGLKLASVCTVTPTNELAVETNSSDTVLESITYAYDVFGNKLSESITTGGSTTTQGFAYDANNTLYADVNSSGVIQTHYVSGVTGPNTWLARVISRAVRGFWTTIRARCGWSSVPGGVLNAVAYDAFGNVTNPTTVGNFGELGFPGMQYDAATQTYVTPARDYDPEQRRWTTADPRGLFAGPNHYQSLAMPPRTTRPHRK